MTSQEVDAKMLRKISNLMLFTVFFKLVFIIHIVKHKKII